MNQIIGQTKVLTLCTPFLPTISLAIEVMFDIILATGKNNISMWFPSMAFSVVEFSRQGYKIRKVFG